MCSEWYGGAGGADIVGLKEVGTTPRPTAASGNPNRLAPAGEGVKPPDSEVVGGRNTPLPAAPGDEAAADMLPKAATPGDEAEAPAGDAACMDAKTAGLREVCTATEPQPCETIHGAGACAGKKVSGVCVKNLKGPFIMACIDCVGPGLNWVLKGAWGSVPGTNLGSVNVKAMMTKPWRSCDLSRTYVSLNP